MTGSSALPGPTPLGPCAQDAHRDAGLLVRHLTHALSTHMRQLHQRGLPVPAELASLMEFLLWAASSRQNPPTAADLPRNVQSDPMPERLLVTKSEAAERLSVSVRTVERLVSAGRLPQVHVERSARFRVADIKYYVNDLRSTPADDTAGQSFPAGHEPVD